MEYFCLPGSVTIPNWSRLLALVLQFYIHQSAWSKDFRCDKNKEYHLFSREMRFMTATSLSVQALFKSACVIGCFIFVAGCLWETIKTINNARARQPTWKPKNGANGEAATGRGLRHFGPQLPDMWTSRHREVYHTKGHHRNVGVPWKLCVCLCHDGYRMPPAAAPCHHPPQVRPTVYTTTPVSIMTQPIGIANTGTVYQLL